MIATRPRRGFTLAELLISLTIALVILTSATAFSVNSWRTRRSWTAREGVDRGARFVGLSLARDLQEAGISLESTPTFASLSTSGDTITVLSVPFEPTEAPVYAIYDDGDTLPNYPPGGNCGATCIEFLLPNGQPLRLAEGDIAQLRVSSVRRVLLLNAVSNQGNGRFRVGFLDVPMLLGLESGLDSMLLARSGTTLQKLTSVRYWRDAYTNGLFRATAFTSSGAPVRQLVASNVESFEARLLFTNNAEAATYNGSDADTLNDGNDVVGARIRAQMRSDHSDPAVNGGQPILRWYEWKVAPRNLLYEKNRSN